METNRYICKDNESFIYKTLIFFLITGKSLISKERCIQTAQNERFAEDVGSKNKANPVFFISLAAVDRDGIVEKVEYIFDVYTKSYDFHGSYVKVVSAQDLWKFYKRKNCNRRNDRRNINIYELVEFFIGHHPNGHFVLDECPFLSDGKRIICFIDMLNKGYTIINVIKEG